MMSLRPPERLTVFTQDAVDHGADAAFILAHFHFFIAGHLAEGKNQHEGRTWNYNTAQGLAKLIPHLSVDQVRYRLKKLIEAGVLRTGNFNQTGFDRTLWYAFEDEKGRFGTETPMSENPHIEAAEVPDRSGESPGPIPTSNTTSDPSSETKDGSDASRLPVPAEPVEQKKLPPNGTPGRYFDQDSAEYRAARYFFDALAEQQVPHVLDVMRKKPEDIEAELQAWADEFRKLHDLDDLKWGAIRLILDYLLHVDDFWIPKGNLQTARKLREKKNGVARWKTWLKAALDHQQRGKKSTGDGAASGVDIDRMNSAFDAAA